MVLWVARRGKPYQAALFTIHKLSAIISIVLAALFYGNQAKSSPAAGAVLWLAIAAAISAALLIASGALMSAKKEDARCLRVVHIAFTALLLFFCGGIALALL